ncbi:MAG: hypothetical protein M4D80_05010 [Myxococcota bacterium]|nr:hypothetical protein [Myxococcota bacterium]
MRRAVWGLLLLPGLATADTFGGFSGVDRPYLVNADKICAPVKVEKGAAAGAPVCEKAAADIIAKLSFKEPVIQSGAKATFAATASGRTLTITRKQAGTPVLTWTAPDTIKVVDLYADQYESRIAVTFTIRRAGNPVTDVVAFDLGQGASTTKPVDPNPTMNPPPSTNPTPAPPADPKLTKALEAARKAKGAKAIAAWKAVLAIDADNSEAAFRIAQTQMAAKQQALALAMLEALAKSPKPDAIEWLIEARYDAAFAGLRADAKFRAAVGLDKKGTSNYERLMGFGGQWEQTGTPCDKPEIRFNVNRDRTFKLRVKTVCQGSVFDSPFKGTWRIDGTHIVLTLPNKGKAATVADEAGCEFQSVGDEDSLRCQIGRDIEFTVLPTRR